MESTKTVRSLLMEPLYRWLTEVFISVMGLSMSEERILISIRTKAGDWRGLEPRAERRAGSLPRYIWESYFRLLGNTE